MDVYSVMYKARKVARFHDLRHHAMARKYLVNALRYVNDSDAHDGAKNVVSNELRQLIVRVDSKKYGREH